MSTKPQMPPASIKWWRDDMARTKQAIKLEQPYRRDDNYGREVSGLGRRDRPTDDSDHNVNIMRFRAM